LVQTSQLDSVLLSLRHRSLVPLLLALWLSLGVGRYLVAAPAVRSAKTPAVPAETASEATEAPAEAAATETEVPARTEPAAEPVHDWMEAQVELSRRGFSSGSIDGVRGLQSATALSAFQRNEGLRESGELDQDTLAVLLLTAPALTQHVLTEEELAQLQPLSTTWLEKSEQTALAYATVLEFVAERYRASPKCLRKLNPDVNWENISPGTALTVPAVRPLALATKAALLHVRLADHVLEATDDTGRIIAHFPVSIARNVEKRPVGELHVTVVIPNPNYTFDPEVFPESPEAAELGRKLIIPPGPNNPVGLAWIGLDRAGYGIHGTPDPEKVGRTESHGCFRLANWDAVTLLKLAWVGLPVTVEP
jgi:lipoprotein-anchoring transpeptidase ErfK/SrfK